jgi:hypothetical protein
MPGKFARWAVALVAGLAVLAGARADEDEKPKEKKKEIKITLPEPYAKAAKACQECIKACGAGAKVCADKFKDGEKKYATPFRWMQDTSQSCQLAFVVVIRNGPALKLVGETCAKVCDECAKACKDFEDDELKDCAKQCAACAKAVRDLLKGGKPAKKDDKKAKDDKVAKLELSELPEAVTLKAGAEFRITVKVTRKNFDGDVLVTINDLPKKVTVKDTEVKIAKGERSAQLTLSAAEDAPAVNEKVVKVTATGPDGKPKVSGTFKLTILNIQAEN